jgi:hypothetical protein
MTGPWNELTIFRFASPLELCHDNILLEDSTGNLRFIILVLFLLPPIHIRRFITVHHFIASDFFHSGSSIIASK